MGRVYMESIREASICLQRLPNRDLQSKVLGSCYPPVSIGSVILQESEGQLRNNGGPLGIGTNPTLYAQACFNMLFK